MILRLKTLALGAIALSSVPLAYGLDAKDIPADVPVSQLISSATAALVQGNGQDALTYFDIAITKDPQNYLTIFRRGAAYLQLGKSAQASHDFDRVLAMKPGFEGALVQRAKIRSRNGDWSGAKKDYETAGKKGGDEIRELEEAQGAATLAAEAEKAGDWAACTGQSDVVIAIAGASMEHRQRRARCRFEKGDIIEGISDLHHIAQNTGSSDAYLQISATSFFALSELDTAIAQASKCLHSDPDSKPCSKLRKREKAVDKQIKKIRGFLEKRQYTNAVKLLVKSSEDAGLIEEVKEDTQQYRDQGLIHTNAPSQLYDDLVETTCEAYTEVSPIQVPVPINPLTSPPDEQPQESPTLLRRSLNPQPQLPTRLNRQSHARTRRRRLRTSDPHAKPSQRAPPVLTKSARTPPKSANTPKTLQTKRLLQSPRRIAGLGRTRNQTRIPEACYPAPSRQGVAAGCFARRGAEENGDD